MIEKEIIKEMSKIISEKILRTIVNILILVALIGF